MAYVRKRGKQIVIVQGERDPERGGVHQRILFTIFSKAEALQILGRGNGGRASQFRYLLEEQYPDIKFNWKELNDGISESLNVLPDLYEYKGTRIRSQFRQDLCAFARQLMLADPQDLLTASDLIKEHRIELEYLVDLIQWRLKLREQESNEWNMDNPFCWRFTLQGAGVPPDIEETVAGFYKRGEHAKAEVLFRLLIDCFDGYAEGYNYLGLIALGEDRLEEASGHFRKTIELGRKLFPKRIPRKGYWRDLKTRPYMRGLRNLTITMNRARRYEEALELCERLEKECGDDIETAVYRASVYLNTGRWHEAADAARYLHKIDASESLVAGFALFELQRHEEALASFLHGALNYPRAARMLAGLKTPRLSSYDEAQDHNAGVYLSRDLHEYLYGTRRKSRTFLKRLLKDPHAADLLAEIQKLNKRWREQRGTDEREVFDRMNLMKTPEFARQEAEKLEGFHTCG